METDEFKDLLTKLPQYNHLSSSKSKQYQSKAIETKVLLMNLNTTMTELAKSLIYKNIHLYLYDCDLNGKRIKISKEDVTNNYYLKEEDIGKERVQVLYQQLVPLNITVSITILDNLSNITLIRGLSVACLGFSAFKTMSHYEEYFSRRNIVFYCINHSGTFGFFYNNLKDMNEIKKKRRVLSISYSNRSTINNLSPQSSQVSLLKGSQLSSSPSSSSKMFVLSQSNRSNNNGSNGNGNDIDLVDKLIKKNAIMINPLFFDKKEELFINQIKTSRALGESCSINNDKQCPHMKITNDQYLQFIIYLIEMYYRKNVNCIQRENPIDKFQKKIIYINNYLSSKGFKCFANDESFQAKLKKFLLNFNEEFSHISSALGELVAKEILKYITETSIPRHGLNAIDFKMEAFDYFSFLSV